jgi:PAS domain-containing protein
MNNTMHIISLGAGVQSTTMLLMAGHGEIEPKPKYAIFADTGWEPKAVYAHLEWLKTKALEMGIEIITVQKGNIREDIMNGAINKSRTANMPFYVIYNGEKGIVPRGCTGDYKIQAINKKAREILGYKPKQRIPAGALTKWMGISMDEIYRMKQGQYAWELLRYPLIEKEMTRLDCMNWLTKHGYPIPPKSSCIGCPFHNDRMWLEIKRNHSDEWQEAVEFEKTLHEYGLRGMKGKVYLHKSCRPLEEVDLQEDQMDLFDDGFMNECAGVCGV